MEQKNSAEILKVAWIKVGDSSCRLRTNRLGIYHMDISIDLIDNDILENIDWLEDTVLSEDIDSSTDDVYLKDKFIVKLLKHYSSKKRINYNPLYFLPK